MTDFGQFQSPFAEVPLDPKNNEPETESQEQTEVWWVDDEDEETSR